MEDLNSLKVGELRGRAEAAGIEGFQAMSKSQLVDALQPNPQGPPDLEGKQFVFNPKKNKYDLVDIPAPSPPPSRRYFDQKATLYTDETSKAPLARAYNLEHTIPITDVYERTGAKDRGQKLGDASGGQHLEDQQPENW